MSPNPPYTHRFDLATVSGRTEIVLSASAPERAAIANWLGAVSVDSFEAKVRISRKGDNRYGYEAEFAAGVTQSCVITLEPVSSTLEGEFERSLLIAPKLSARHEAAPRSRKIEVLEGEEEEPELVASSEIDLAAPILEELALSLDPYPRAPGAQLPATEEPATPKESPFAVLGKLKEGAADNRAKPSKRPKR